ncbi:MAG: hypothetical protein ABL869_07020 [Candidatus Nitrotoga sp.]
MMRAVIHPVQDSDEKFHRFEVDSTAGRHVTLDMRPDKDQAV